MDDDDFGGFEAAEAFEGGNCDQQMTSPAIPWAAFPTVPDVQVSPVVSAEVLQEQSGTFSCMVSSDEFIPSTDDIVTDGQLSSDTVNLADIKEKTPLSVSPLEIPVSPLNLTEDLKTTTADDDDDKLGLNESMQLQPTLSSLEVKLKAAEEEKGRIKKELEDLLEKHRVLETDFLKDKEDKLISHQDRYHKLQEKHNLELDELRKAGHEALAIIVEEFKALLQSTVQHREEAIEKQYASAVEKQAQKCEELLIAQHQRLLDMLDKEREVLKEKIQDSLLHQSEECKENLEKYMASTSQSNQEALAAAVKVEKENMQAAILAAVKEERENMEKCHSEEKAAWQAERNKDREKIAKAIEDSMQELKESYQATIKAAIIEEQKKSAKAVEEAVKETREELMNYVKEQRRLDQVIRQRSLSSLELFLSCAQKQLSSLLQEEAVTTTEAEQQPAAPSN